MRNPHCSILNDSPAAPGARYLVIGYGNRLRGDDAVGPELAEAIGALKLPGVKTIACDLLTPELADPLSQVCEVIFVDAALTAPRKVALRLIKPANSAQIMAHAADPRTLLALARDVFGHAPKAWLLTIPAEDLSIGEKLSPLAQRGLKSAERIVRGMITKSNDAGASSKKTSPNTRRSRPRHARRQTE